MNYIHHHVSQRNVIKEILGTKNEACYDTMPICRTNLMLSEDWMRPMWAMTNYSQQEITAVYFN